MIKICELVAGSRLYGLDTPESDTDTRGVFLDTNPGSIIGLERLENMKKESEDTLLFELRHFLRGLRKTNTQMVEILFADDDKFHILEPQFKFIQQNKFRLIDSQILFKSLLGYIESERRLANGERTGVLGGKRKQSLEKYGFSPKNFSHLFRLSHCGTVFFEKDEYPVDIRKSDLNFRDFLFSVKTEPEKFTKEYLNTLANKAVERLKIAFDNRINDHRFDLEFANRICVDFYLPFLENLN